MPNVDMEKHYNRRHTFYSTCLLLILCICSFVNVNSTSSTESFDLHDGITVVATRKFNVERCFLYEFVTLPHMVTRWMDWLHFFMAADEKPFQIGKNFKIFSKSGETMLLRMVDLDDGYYVAFDAELAMKPRVELWFSNISPQNECHEEVCPVDMSAGAIRTVWTEEAPLQSGLTIRLSYGEPSFIFRHVVGKLYKLLLERKFEQSLKNLNALFMSFDEGLPEESI